MDDWQLGLNEVLFMMNDRQFGLAEFFVYDEWQIVWFGWVVAYFGWLIVWIAKLLLLMVDWQFGLDEQDGSQPKNTDLLMEAYGLEPGLRNRNQSFCVFICKKHHRMGT